MSTTPLITASPSPLAIQPSPAAVPRHASTGLLYVNCRVPADGWSARAPQLRYITLSTWHQAQLRYSQLNRVDTWVVAYSRRHVDDVIQWYDLCDEPASSSSSWSAAAAAALRHGDVRASPTPSDVIEWRHQLLYSESRDFACSGKRQQQQPTTWGRLFTVHHWSVIRLFLPVRPWPQDAADRRRTVFDSIQTSFESKKSS